MNLKPIYVLTGTEPLLRKIFIEDLRKQVFPEGATGFNDDQFNSKEKNDKSSLLNNDYQVLQAYNYIKAWKVFKSL